MFVICIFLRTNDAEGFSFAYWPFVKYRSFAHCFKLDCLPCYSSVLLCNIWLKKSFHNLKAFENHWLICFTSIVSLDSITSLPPLLKNMILWNTFPSKYIDPT